MRLRSAAWFDVSPSPLKLRPLPVSSWDGGTALKHVGSDYEFGPSLRAMDDATDAALLERRTLDKDTR